MNENTPLRQFCKQHKEENSPRGDIALLIYKLIDLFDDQDDDTVLQAVELFINNPKNEESDLSDRREEAYHSFIVEFILYQQQLKNEKSIDRL